VSFHLTEVQYDGAQTYGWPTHAVLEHDGPRWRVIAHCDTREDAIRVKAALERQSNGTPVETVSPYAVALLEAIDGAERPSLPFVEGEDE
jgi:hypothetical protein